MGRFKNKLRVEIEESAVHALQRGAAPLLPLPPYRHRTQMLLIYNFINSHYIVQSLNCSGVGRHIR